jgi:hypothetical protein
MKRMVVLGLAATGVAVAAVFWWILPVIRVERGLDIPPAPETGVVTEEVRRSGEDCGSLVCPQRIRVFSVAKPASEMCAFYADRLEGDVTVLTIGPGTARCGWTIRHDRLLIGVIVEEPPGGTEVVVSSRLVP